MECSAVVQCSAVQCSAVQCSAVQCSAVQCSAVQCSAVQCSAVQCSAVQCAPSVWCEVHCACCQRPRFRGTLNIWSLFWCSRPGKKYYRSTIGVSTTKTLSWRHLQKKGLGGSCKIYILLIFFLKPKYWYFLNWLLTIDISKRSKKFLTLRKILGITCAIANIHSHHFYSFFVCMFYISY